MKNFNELRQESNKFVYESYELIDTAEVISLLFTYQLIENDNNTVFTHKLELAKTEKISLESDLDNIIFNIGLAEAINY